MPRADDLWNLSGTFRSDSEELARLINESGQRMRGRNNDPAYLARLAEATEFLADVIEGRRSTFWLQEALSTSDFPLLMGDILDRQLLGKWQETPATWPNYCRRGTVRDFRAARRLQVDGLEGRYIPDYEKSEGEPPKEDNELTESGYTVQVSVYEKAAALNWKMLINDDLDAFSDIPERLARGARRTEEYLATSLFVDANGPHASFYTEDNGNIVDGNPELSIEGLQTAFTQLSQATDANGEPIAITAVELVVPPALEVTSMNILNALQLELNTAGGTTDSKLIAVNWMKQRVRLSVNHYIPVVATTNGDTSWFRFASPSVGRPALEMSFLRGYEQPGLYQKAPNTMRVGGAVDPILGDFDTNEIRYKGMHILGGTRMESKATVASNGTGS
jgi:hypothetical protein